MPGGPVTVDDAVNPSRRIPAGVFMVRPFNPALYTSLIP